MRTLLKCNSHTTEFTELKYTILWFLMYSQNCAAVITISFKTSKLKKKNPNHLPKKLHTF